MLAVFAVKKISLQHEDQVITKEKDVGVWHVIGEAWNCLSYVSFL
jgi:hypothetical protein